MKHDGPGGSAQGRDSSWQTAPHERVAASARVAHWRAGAWLVFWLAAAGLVLAQCLDCGTPVRPFVVGKTWTAARSSYCVMSHVLVVG